MEKVKDISKQLYRHSFVRYVAIGGTTFALQFALLLLFHGAFGIVLPVAVSIAYWLAIVFNFTANRLWAFEAVSTRIAKHATAYGILLGINYIFTLAFVTIATHLGMVYTVASILAVIIQVSWTYVIYKKVIFK